MNWGLIINLSSDKNMNYRDLYEALKKEKGNNELQLLEKKFFAKISQHIKAQREELEMIDEKTLRGRLIAKEGSNTRRLLASLVEHRRYKIFNAVLDGKQISSEFLTNEEEIIYSKVLSAKEETDKTLKTTLQGHVLKTNNIEIFERPKKILVRFLQAIPAIVGSDMRTYGPFKIEDIASIPIENANILIKRGMAVEVEIS